MRTAALCVMVAAVLASPAQAQVREGMRRSSCSSGPVSTRPVLRVGQSVRAERYDSGERIEGAIVSCSGSALLVATSPDSLSRIDLSHPIRLEVMVGRGVSKGEAALIGGLTGGLLAGFFGHALTSECGDGYYTCDTKGIGVTLAFPGFLVGGVLGAALGSDQARREWVPVTIERAP